MIEINCKKDEIEVLESLCKSSTYFAEEFGKYFELFKQNITNDFPITLNTDIVKLDNYQLKLYQNQINIIDRSLLTKEQIRANKDILNDIAEIIKRLMY